jgi:hypothetical protein
MKVIRDVHSLFQEEILKIRNNQQIPPHTAIMVHVFMTQKIIETTVQATPKNFGPAVHQVKNYSFIRHN